MSDKQERVAELAAVDTEVRNIASAELDRMSAAEIVRLMNREDKMVPVAVEACRAMIAEAVEAAGAALRSGQRIIYMGAGTSGRLGVLDASECPPTFGADPKQVIGLIAGGEPAMFRSQEGAEDDREAGVKDLKEINIKAGDFLVGLAASGRTPYVIAGLEYARSVGVKTAAITCNRGSACGAAADIAIEVSPGPEVLTGSTRLKAGTVQKMVLNMISTGAMVLNGKCFGNLMVDVQATNEKLQARAVRIVMQATDASFESAEATLNAAKGHAKTAILALLLDIPVEEAATRLDQTGSHLRVALADSLQ